MDWSKLTQNKSLAYALAGLASSFGLAFAFYFSFPLFKELNQSFVVKEFQTIGVFDTYRKHYHHFFDEIQKLSNADQREQSLLREIASITRDLELERGKNTEKAVESETSRIAEQLKIEAGSSLARIPDTIHYTAPDSISPHQLQTLGLEYFRKKDYEKAAVILHTLMTLKDDQGFQTPENCLISSIAWYKLKHYEMASDFLKRVQKAARPGSVTFRQAMLWDAIVQQSRGNKNLAQAAITRLISAYPQSEEASWINHDRVPASTPQSDEKAVQENAKQEKGVHHE